MPVEERAIVQAAAIDLSDNGYKITLQLNKTGGGTGIPSDDPVAPDSITVSGEGKTLPEAFGEINSGQNKGKDIFFGQTRYFILSEKLLTQKGSGDFLSFMRSKIYSIPNSYVLAAKENSASEIVEENAKNSILPDDHIENNLKHLIKEGYINQNRLLDMFKDEFNKAGCAIIPVIHKAQGSGSEEQAGIKLQIGGAAVLRRGMLTGFLSEQELRGIVWAQGSFENTMLSVKDGEISLTLLPKRSRSEISISDKKIDITVKSTSNARVSRLTESPPYNTSDTANTESPPAIVAFYAEKEISLMIKTALEKCIYEYKINPFKLSDVRLYGKKREWNRLARDWDEYTEKINLSVIAKVNVETIR
ncbi:MAG: hypothetical protein FWG69_03790 [Oscillospiraceae bacterium]|nr:hypothetical protein [Oscillospiraceae bacterium]